MPSAEIIAGRCEELAISDAEFQCPGINVNDIQRFLSDILRQRSNWGRNAVNIIRKDLADGVNAINEKIENSLREGSPLRKKVATLLLPYHSAEEIQALLKLYKLALNLTRDQLEFQYTFAERSFVSVFVIFTHMLEKGYFEHADLLDPKSPNKKINPKTVGKVFGELFSEWFAPYPTLPSQREVIRMIIKAGGTPILCHPALAKGIRTSDFLDSTDKRYSKRGISPEEWINYLVSYGLQGIELYKYSAVGFSETGQEKANNYFRLLAEKNNLLVVYGSDDHYSNLIGGFGGKLTPADLTSSPAARHRQSL